jgi:hypothetical protein
MRQIEIFFLQVMLGIFYTNFVLFCCLPKIPIDQNPKSPVDQKRATEFVRLRSPTLTTHGVRGKEKSEPRVLRVSTYISNTPPRFHMAKPNGKGKREWTERPERT